MAQRLSEAERAELAARCEQLQLKLRMLTAELRSDEALRVQAAARRYRAVTGLGGRVVRGPCGLRDNRVICERTANPVLLGLQPILNTVCFSRRESPLRRATGDCDMYVAPSGCGPLWATPWAHSPLRRMPRTDFAEGVYVRFSGRGHLG